MPGHYPPTPLAGSCVLDHVHMFFFCFSLDPLTKKHRLQTFTELFLSYRDSAAYAVYAVLRVLTPLTPFPSMLS